MFTFALFCIFFLKKTICYELSPHPRICSIYCSDEHGTDGYPRQRGQSYKVAL